MPIATINGVDLFYEEIGSGEPLVFAHEFYGDYQSWHLQVRFFARRYRTMLSKKIPGCNIGAEPFLCCCT